MGKMEVKISWHTPFKGTFLRDTPLLIFFSRKTCWAAPWFCSYICSVADPEWFIPDPDQALNFKSSWSRFGSRSNPYYLSIMGNNKKNTLNLIKKKNLPTTCHFIFYSTGTVLQYTQSRITRPIIINKYLFICSFIFCWSGSGTIISDPDPGKSSGSMQIRIRNSGYLNKKFNICTYSMVTDTRAKHSQNGQSG